MIGFEQIPSLAEVFVPMPAQPHGIQQLDGDWCITSLAEKAVQIRGAMEDMELAMNYIVI